MEAGPETDPTVFLNPQPTAVTAVVTLHLLKRHHPMSDTLHFQITALGGLVVNHQAGAITLGEILLVGQHLPAVLERAFGE